MRIIGGEFRGRRIIAPKGQQTRPTSDRFRESFFNICKHRVEGCDFLDLYAGSGAMGLEALSRGAHSSTFIDNARPAFQALKENIAILNVEDRATVWFGDASLMLQKLQKKGVFFSLIFADPPYHGKFLQEIFPLVEALLREGGSFFFEAGEGSDLTWNGMGKLAFVEKREQGNTCLLEWVRSPS